MFFTASKSYNYYIGNFLLHQSVIYTALRKTNLNFKEYYYFSQIDTFIDYLERKNHPKVFQIWCSIPRIVPIKWKTDFNGVDCGIFVMRHMEMYIGEEEFLHELHTEGAGLKGQLKILRAKYLAKILLQDLNLKKKNLIKEAEAFGKKQGKKSKIISQVDVKVDQNLIERFSETLVKALE